MQNEEMDQPEVTEENELLENDSDIVSGEVIEVPIGDSYAEQLLREVISGYQRAFNEHNKDTEINYVLTITTHKVAYPEGNKDTAYLRLARQIRPKGSEDNSEWNGQIIHQEIYKFRNVKERVNPKAPWKEQLYVNALGRLVSAGLEYAELLKNLEQREQQGSVVPQVEEEKKIVVTNQMPAPLTDKDKEYKMWVENERKKEGL